MAVGNTVLELVVLEVTEVTAASETVLLAEVSGIDEVIYDVIVAALVDNNTENGVVVNSSCCKIVVAGCSELATVVDISRVVAGELLLKCIRMTKTSPLVELRI